MSQVLKVRLATKNDAATVRSVHLRTWESTYGPVVPAPLAAERLRVHSARDWEAEIEGTTVLVLTAGDEVVGYCQCHDSESDDLPAAGEVHRLYILPEWQGRGGGRLLMTSAEAHFTRIGRILGILWAYGPDARARGFYEHLGWVPDGTERYDDQMTDVRYQKRLDGATIIRRATTDDATAVGDVFLASRATMTYLPRIHTDEDTRAHFAGLSAEKETWVAEHEGRVVGFAVIDGGWLEHLYVHPSRFNSSTGSRLFERVTIEHPEGFRFWMFQRNDGARRFYERKGCVLEKMMDGAGNEEHEPDALYAWPGKESLERMGGMGS